MQRPRDRDFIDNGPARDIDQQRVWLYPDQRRLIQKMHISRPARSA